jgi:hypothetical protein
LISPEADFGSQVGSVPIVEIRHVSEWKELFNETTVPESAPDSNGRKEL